MSSVLRGVPLNVVGASMISATDGSDVDTGVASQVSLDGGAYSATTVAAQLISDGTWFTDLTAAEMTADTIIVKFAGGGSITRTVHIHTDRSLASGVAAAGAANTISLATDSSAVNGTYTGDVIQIVGGAGQGQSRLIVEYTGIGRLAFVAPSWTATPNNSSQYQITPSGGSTRLSLGRATGGTVTTIDLAANDSTTDNIYDGAIVKIIGGTGQGQSRVITFYNGTNQIAVVSPNWATAPTAGSDYEIVPGSANIQTWQLANAPALVNGRLDSSLGAILAEPVAESSAAGALANNFSQFYDVDPVSSNDINDVGGGGGGGGDLQSILGTPLTENPSTPLADNFTAFFDVDPVTTKTVDDVGGGGGGGLLPEQFRPTALAGQTSGTLGDIQSLDGSFASVVGNSAQMTVDFAPGAGEQLLELTCSLVVKSQFGGGEGDWEIFNFNLTQWDQVRTLPNLGTEQIYFANVAGLSGAAADYVDGTGVTRYRFSSPGAVGGTIDLDFASVIGNTATGSVPTPGEIADAVDQLQSATHGYGSWNSDYTNTIQIESVTNATEFVIQSPVTGFFQGDFVLVLDGSNRGTTSQFAGSHILNYQPNTPSAGLATITIAEPLPFTVLPGMLCQLRINAPADVDSFMGVRLTQTTGGLIANNFSTLYDNAGAASTLTLDEILEVGATIDANVTTWQGAVLSGTLMIENAGSTPRWTSAALSQAPTGGGGSGGLTPLFEGTATAGSQFTVTLPATASDQDDFYNGSSINLTAGPGAGQSRLIQDYFGSTRIATVDSTFVVDPGAGTEVEIVQGRADVELWRLAVPAGTDAATGYLEVSVQDSPETLTISTIQTLSTQTQFTITNGSGDDGAYEGARIVISRPGSGPATGTVLTYVGSTRAITLAADPGIYNMANGDAVEITLAGAGGGGGGSGNLTSILGTALNEDTAGNLATNFGTFYNNANVAPTGAKVDDVGSITQVGIDAIVDGTWDALTVDHQDPGSMGEALTAAGASSDPWPILVPGSYPPGSAGWLLGNGLAPVSPVIVADDRTWTPLAGSDTPLAMQLVTLVEGDNAYVAMDFTDLLNPGARINSITSVTDELLPGSITLGIPEVNQSRTRCQLMVTGLTSGDSHQLKFVILTSDGDTLAALGNLAVE